MMSMFLISSFILIHFHFVFVGHKFANT